MNPNSRDEIQVGSPGVRVEEIGLDIGPRYKGETLSECNGIAEGKIGQLSRED